MATVLRPLADDDLDRLFGWENDDRAVKMAAFTRATGLTTLSSTTGGCRV